MIVFKSYLIVFSLITFTRLTFSLPYNSWSSSLSSSSIISPLILKPVRTCEPIRVKICHGIGYNETGMPNQFGHEVQQEIDLLIQSFLPLIQYNCASQLKFFLCSAYLPMCTEKIPETIGPCRPLCESVRNRCHHVLKQFGFPWQINCTLFPKENNHEHMCMEGPDLAEHEKSDYTTYTSLDNDYAKGTIKKKPNQSKAIERKTTKVKPFYDDDNLFTEDEQRRTKNKQINKQTTTLLKTTKEERINKNDHNSNNNNININNCNNYRHKEKFYYLNSSKRCVQNCESDILFTKENKQFAERWLLAITLITIIFCLFTILTYLIDMSSFKYPEKIIVYICINYLIICCAYLMHLFIGRYSLSCFSVVNSTGDELNHLTNINNKLLLLVKGSSNFSCYLISFIIYFCTMSSYLWWTIICFIWCIINIKKWTTIDIEKISVKYFHLITIGVPTIKTIAIFVLRLVDADELIGVCFIGNHSLLVLLIFIIIPITVYLLIGLLFLSIGLYSSLNQSKYKQTNQQQNSNLTSTSSICSTNYRTRPEILYQLNPKRNAPKFSYNLSSSSTSSAISHTRLSNNQSPYLINKKHNLRNKPLNDKQSNSTMNSILLTNSRVATTTTVVSISKQNSLLITYLGIYSITFMIPLTFVLVSYLYEYLYRDEWYSKYSQLRPYVVIFILRIMISLFIGIKTGLWIWSIKRPLIIWRNFFTRFICKQKQVKKFQSYTMVKNPTASLNGSFNVNNNNNSNKLNLNCQQIEETTIDNF